MNTNKADGFGPGGAHCTVFVMLLCAEFWRRAAGYEKPGKNENGKW